MVLRQKPNVERKREQQQVGPGTFAAEKANDGKFRSEHQPEERFGEPGPGGTKAAAEKLLPVTERFTDRGELEDAPGAAGDLHIVAIPSGINLVLPAVPIESFDDHREELGSIQPALVPIFRNAEIVLVRFEERGLKIFSFADPRGGCAETALVTSPTANNRLEEK